MKKKIMDILFAAILFYCAMLIFLFVSQRNMMYFPGGPRENIGMLTDITPEIINLQSAPDIQFDAWHWPARDNMPTLVFFHGNGQAYQFWVNKMMLFHRQGYGIYFTDYRGYGGVNGKPTELGIYEDARAHLDAFFKKTNIPSNKLIYFGESLGTGVTTQMATEFPPKAIIYESAYSATSDVAKGRYWMFPVDLLMKDQFRSIDKIKDLTMPKLFIHGDKDFVVPIRYGHALYDAAPEPKQWITIENSGHNNLYDNGAQLHISEFLSTLLTSQTNKE